MNKSIIYLLSFFVLAIAGCGKINFPRIENLEGKIVYGEKGSSISVIELPSRKITKIYHTSDLSQGEAAYPSWSDDGKKIVFSKRDKDNIFNLYIMNADGSNISLFLRGDRETNLKAPSWSPDGNKIAFLKGKAGVSYLNVIDINKMESKILADIPMTEGQPTWSPDGKSIAFTVRKEVKKETSSIRGYDKYRATYEIFIIGLDGSSLRKLSDGESPSWSPNGRKIAYLRNYKGYNELYIRDNEEKNNYRLTSSGGMFRGIVSNPAWSPDGNSLLYAKRDWLYGSSFYVVSIDRPDREIRIKKASDAIFGVSWIR